MLGIESPVCQCGWARETATHIIAHCPRFAEIRRQIADPCTGRVNVKSLTNSLKKVYNLARWFIQLQILPQFNLTEELLYGSGESGPE